MKKEERPWGNFLTLAFNEECTVKVLNLKPEEELSLQIHNNRDEKWYFFNKATVQLGKKKKKVKEGTIIKIPKGKPHRIIAGKNEVRVLEVSFGRFDENDEIRLEDKYGRKK